MYRLKGFSRSYLRKEKRVYALQRMIHPARSNDFKLFLNYSPYLKISDTTSLLIYGKFRAKFFYIQRAFSHIIPRNKNIIVNNIIYM